MSLLNSGSRFLYDQVFDLVVGQIRAGSLQPGDRLPSLRRMSSQLKVSVATVMQGYVSLEQEGFIDAKPQSGYYVRLDSHDHTELPNPTTPQSIARDVRLEGLSQQMMALARSNLAVPLALANLAAELLPGKALCRILHRVANRDSARVLDYMDCQGDAELRRQIAYRASKQGVLVDPEQIIITNGATEALALSLRSLTKLGDTVAVESPAYFSLLQLIEEFGLKAVEIPSHPRDGLDVDQFEKVIKRLNVKALVCISNFNNPYGSLMPDKAKQRLVELANARDVRIIEDDIYGDLHFGTHRPRPISSFDQSGNVVTCSSFSKTLAPGFRVGWLIADRGRAEMLSRKYTVSIANSSITQMAVIEFLANGGYDRHLRNLRRRLQIHVMRMRNELAKTFPTGTRISEPQGGFVLWVELPGNVDVNKILERSLAQGISFLPGSLFTATGKYQNCMRISCGNSWTSEIQAGISRLAKTVLGCC
jgi:DNA-binding transcriptional MocR family regulator